MGSPLLSRLHLAEAKSDQVAAVVTRQPRVASGAIWGEGRYYLPFQQRSAQRGWALVRDGLAPKSTAFLFSLLLEILVVSDFAVQGHLL